MAALEETFQVSNNAVYVDKVNHLSEKLDKLYQVSCELAAPGDLH